MSGGEKLALSVAIITLNEEERLADCLASVSFAADIVVVDSGSTDQTVNIARSGGARVLREPWRGFGPQKQFAIEHCRYPWVLVLDADERVPPETAAEIGRTLAEPPRFAAYTLPRRNYFCGRWIRGAGWWPDRTARLFDREQCRMSDDLVHERLVAKGPVGELTQPVVHLANRSLEQTIDKINRYSSAGAEMLLARGESASIGKAVLRGSWAFAYNYFFRRGFLDGAEGLIIAVTDGMNKFFKYAKLREMQQRQAGRRPEHR